jgi:hypothetical protein
MYKHTITIENMTGEMNDKETQAFETISEISKNLQRLQSEHACFIILETSPPINNVNFIQVLNWRYKKGIFKKHWVDSFIIEMEITKSDGSLAQWGTVIYDFDEIKNILTEYITLQKAPNFSLWEDISRKYLT